MPVFYMTFLFLCSHLPSFPLSLIFIPLYLTSTSCHLLLPLCLFLFLLTPETTDFATFLVNRPVQSEADEVRGPPAGATQGARPGEGGAGKADHLQHIRIQCKSGGEESHSGWQRPECGHRGHSGLSSSIEWILYPHEGVFSSNLFQIMCYYKTDFDKEV